MTEIVGGQKIEKHMCQECAGNEGITIKSNVPISQLLEDFILQSSEGEDSIATDDPTCPVCGLCFSECREQGQLGCPHDYDAFADNLTELLAHAQQGATQHMGKVPQRVEWNQKKQNSILKLRAELKGAVATEDYELAATLRDQIKELET